MAQCTLCKTEIAEEDADVYAEMTTFKRLASPGLPTSTKTRPNGLVAHGKCVRGDAAPEQIPGQEPLF